MESYDRSKTFVLGVGAQKSGTTWLHSYLTEQPHADFGDLKEYHVFDVLHVDCCKYADAKKNFRMVNRRPRAKGKSETLRRYFRDHPDQYFKYFDMLLKRQDIYLTGDITPSYAGLPEAVLHDIKRRFNDRGIQVKAVFLMRDPVGRCISAAKMWMLDRPASFADRSFETVLKELSRTDAFEMRTRYDLTIERLKAVFSPGELYITSYERFFSSDLLELSRLGNFLDLDLLEDHGTRLVNATSVDIDVSIPTKRFIAEHYKRVYEYVDDYIFRVKHVWDSATFVI